MSATTDLDVDDLDGSTVQLIRELKDRGIRSAIVTASRNADDVLAAAGVADLFEEKVDGVVKDLGELEIGAR